MLTHGLGAAIWRIHNWRAQGVAGDRRVLSEAWIDEICSWGAQDRQVRVGTAPAAHAPALCNLSAVGYKCFMWHLKADGTPFRR